MFDAMIDGTLFALRFTPNSDNFVGLMIYTTLNTVIRFGVFYLLIRVVMSALQHGSF